MVKLIIKFITGIMSLPLAVGISISFYNNLKLTSDIAKNMSFFVWGIMSYVVLHLLFYKPTYLYVLGHEAVHAGVSWLFGGKIKSFKVSEKGGSVATDKSNVIVELSPYFVPIYAILITIVYFVLVSSYSINASIFIYLIGFALALHMISTIEVLKMRQPDIMKSGYIFSIVMVYILNIVVISFIFSLVFPNFSISKFFINSWTVSKGIYLAVVKQLFF